MLSFSAEKWTKSSFWASFPEKVDFGLPINPLDPRDFSEIRLNSVSNLRLHMAIKWPKMVQMSWFKDRNVANLMLILFITGHFFIVKQKRCYDVICELRPLCCFWATRGTNGLSGTFENQFFHKFEVFQPKNKWKVHCGQVFRKKSGFLFAH